MDVIQDQHQRLARLHRVREQSLQDLVAAALEAARGPPPAAGPALPPHAGPTGREDD